MNIGECKMWTDYASEQLEKGNVSKAKKYLRWALDELKDVKE